MPPILPDAQPDADSDADDAFDDAVAEHDTKAKKQLNGELKDTADEDADEEAAGDAEDDDDEDLEGKAKVGEEDEDDDEDEEAEFNVESIQDHKFFKGKLLYFIKWQNYPEEENTWEPEEHLLPHSRLILAAYHKKIGGVPQQPMKRGRSKQVLREATSSDDLPGSKRQKRNGAKEAEEVGTWLPKGDQWEDQVDKVETIERNDAGTLMAYIRFHNGKRSKITMEMVYRYCPRPMLRFYEEHLKFK